MRYLKIRLAVVFTVLGLYFAFQAGSYSREAEVMDLRCHIISANDYIEELQDEVK